MNQMMIVFTVVNRVTSEIGRAMDDRVVTFGEALEIAYNVAGAVLDELGLRQKALYSSQPPRQS